MSTYNKVKYGDNLSVTDEGGGVIRVDASGGSGGGGGGSDANYVFTQPSPTTTWTIAHGLGKFPAVDVVDSGGSTLIPDVHYIDVNNVTVTFGGATSGKAYLN